MAKRDLDKLAQITGSDSELKDKKKTEALPEVKTEGLKKKSNTNWRYHSFQMKKDIYERLKVASEDKDLAYTGDLIHAILKAYLDENGY